MRKFSTILGVTLLVTALAVPLFAMGPGWGRGLHMMGNWGTGGHMMESWGNGPDYRGQYNRSYGNLSREQQDQLSQLEQRSYNETARLRKEAWKRSTELDTLLSEPNPDKGKLKALQREINNLNRELADTQLDFELEARTIAPNDRFGKGYGRGYGPGRCRN